MTKVCFWPVSAKKTIHPFNKNWLKKKSAERLRNQKNKKSLKKFITHIFDHVLI